MLDRFSFAKGRHGGEEGKLMGGDKSDSGQQMTSARRKGGQVGAVGRIGRMRMQTNTTIGPKGRGVGGCSGR